MSAMFDAIREAKGAAQEAFEEAFPGTIKINSLPYAAAVAVGRIRWVMTDKGFKLVQDLTVRIKIGVLPSLPALGTTVLYAGRAYKINSLDDGNQTDTTWLIRGERQPGADEAPGPPPGT